MLAPLLLPFHYIILSYRLLFITISISWNNFSYFPYSFSNVTNFKLKFIIFISTSTKPLYLFIKVILFISHYINYCFHHLLICFKSQTSITLRDLTTFGHTFFFLQVYILSFFKNLCPWSLCSVSRSTWNLSCFILFSSLLFLFFFQLYFICVPRFMYP
jgi:hypothetical protein